MYNLNSKMKKFYEKYVVLPEEQKNLLREKRKINEQRLKKGLNIYNNEKKTNYKIIKTLEQGSVAMGTVNANEKDNYDIDIGIIFDEKSIEGVGPQKIKNIVVDSFKSLGKIFKKEPEALSNCVRVQYQDNYHIDFAIYKNDPLRGYLHAGPTEWKERNPSDINNWFKDSIKKHGAQLRQVIRLCKMFSKSRESWDMPGGLVQTVLCVECFEKSDRLDETFYKTLVNIKNRLNLYTIIRNPINKLDLIPNKNHIQQVENFKKRLNKYLEKLEILKDKNCTYNEALSAWNYIFNHKYWTEEISYEAEYFRSKEEQFIEDYYEQALSNENILDVEVYIKNPNDNSKKFKRYYDEKLVPKGWTIFINAKVDIEKPYKVLWKVRNNGISALKDNCLRGKIKNRNIFEEHRKIERIHYNYNNYYNFHQILETALYTGRHYVEVYLIKDNKCISRKKVYINIE